MNARAVHDIAIAYVRGEPMDAEERSRLERDLSSSVLFKELLEEQRSLSRGFDAVRHAHRQLGPAAAQEEVLLKRFREAKRRPAKPGTRFRVWLNVAATVAAAAIVGFTATEILRQEPTPNGGQLQSVAAPIEPARANAEFMPLPYGRAIEYGEGFTVIRAKLGRMGLLHAGVPLSNPLQGGFVDAELLLGADGTVRGIRFIDPVLPTAQTNTEPHRLEDQI